jgi:hypothetical protein
MRASLRRQLDALRARETIVVPLSPAGTRHARLWAGLYDAEAAWIPAALQAASLPGVDLIERDWSMRSTAAGTG